MLDGWRAQMLARGLTTQTIKQRCQPLERFQEFTGEFPWQWRPADVDDFLAGLRSGEKPISLKTLRSYSNAVAMFCSYLTHPGYGWGEFCERTFGDIPSQICFEWNTPRHTTDDAVPAARRAFTKAELQPLQGGRGRGPPQEGAMQRVVARWVRMRTRYRRPCLMRTGTGSPRS